MGAKLLLIFALFLSISWICVDARSLEILDVAVPAAESSFPAKNVKNEKLCTLCEKFTTQAVDYLNDNKTQTEIIERLHHACSQLHGLKEQCLSLVDYYAPIFFKEVGLIHPEEFCTKMNLCSKMSFIHLPRRDDSCTVCHHAIAEVLIKLKDPDTQLEIIETLLKACNRVENFAQKCKKLVFQYGPVFLVNAEKFLETTDICAAIHACKAGEKGAVKSSLSEISLSDA